MKRPVRLALAQVSATPDRATNLQQGLETMRRAADEGAQLIAFPELAFDRFFPCERCSAPPRELASPIPGPLTDPFAELAAELGMVVVLNLYELGDGGQCYDTSPVIDADGRLLGRSRMVHVAHFPGFWEQDYYTPGDLGWPVYDTAVGRVGVAICYDRHYPEAMRSLGVQGAELVVIPQAGTRGEWPEGLFEAEVRTHAFQNGYFAALCNRVGREGPEIDFAGESFVTDPEGVVLARGAAGVDDLLLVDIDLQAAATSTARRLFWRDRRPEAYRD